MAGSVALQAPGLAAPKSSATAADRPRLELSGPKLALALQTLVERGEESGGVEQYVEALRLKARLYRDTFGPPEASPSVRGFDASMLKTLCTLMPTVRRRVGPYLNESRLPGLQTEIERLLSDRGDTATADARIDAFCAAFPDDRGHRWVRDLAAELLHNVDPERYPLMCRWVWDARSNTGVLREIWHGENVDLTRIDVADRYPTYLMLREELSQFLATNGVYRDVLHYVDLLTAQVYAHYISEQGSSYLRADFAVPEDPLQYTRRLLGLDGVDGKGRTRLKLLDGEAQVVHETKRIA